MSPFLLLFRIVRRIHPKHDKIHPADQRFRKF
jgi:hypothetical protein